MTEAYEITVETATPERTRLNGRFVANAQGDEIVQSIVRQLEALPLRGGRLVTFDGQISVAGAIALGHRLAHLYAAVAMFDPKMQGFIVAVSHDPEFAVGQLIAEHPGDV